MIRKLFYPGLHIKRWILLLGVGIVLVSLGIAYWLVQIYRVQPLPDAAATLTLQFLDRSARGSLLFVTGVICIGLAVLKLNQSVITAFALRGPGRMLDEIYTYRTQQRGAKIVVIGGGTGLSVALRGLKEHTSNLTAIVTVADDGGSSGRLRRQLGVLPPGDFRNCLVALADVEPLMQNLFQYRFTNSLSDLDGHSFGNLFIVAMSGVTGNFERGLQEASRVLAVRGRVLPSTLENITLCAELTDAEMVQGESQVGQSLQRIRRVFLLPSSPSAYPEAIKAIHEADLVVVGPGSLYTSVLPNLLVPGVVDAFMTSRAIKVYVCNVATQPGETDGYHVSDHLTALLEHLPADQGPFHWILVNERVDLPMPASGKVHPVPPESDSRFEGRLVRVDVVDESNAVRHDSAKLAQALIRLYAERANGRVTLTASREAR